MKSLRFIVHSVLVSWLSLSGISWAARDVVISTSPSSGGSFSSGIWTPSTTPSNISITDLLVELSSRNVTITTSGAGSGQGNITVNDSVPLSAITLSISRTLTLNAINNININSALTQASSPNPVNLILNADADSNGSGSVLIAAGIDTAGGDLNIGGFSISQSSGTISTGGGDISGTAIGSIAFGGFALTTVGGGVNLTALGAGSSFVSANISTSGGNVSISTSASLSINGAIAAIGGAGAGSINIRSTTNVLAINSTSVLQAGTTSGTLQLQASSNLNVSGDLSGALLDLDTTGSSDISIFATAELNATSGRVDILAGNNITLLGSITAATDIVLRADATNNGVGNVNSSANLTSGALGISMTGRSTTHNSGIMNLGSGNLTITALTGSAAVSGGSIQTNGGSVVVSGPSFSISAPVTTNGGGFTATATTTGSFTNSISTSGGNISSTTTGNLTVSGSLNATGGADAGGVTLSSSSGSLEITPTALLQAGSAGDVILSGNTGIILDGDVLAARNLDVDCVTGNIAVGATATLQNSGTLMAFDAANSTITIASGAIITAGAESKIHLQCRTGSNNIALSVPLSTGTGGLEIFSDNNVTLSTPIVSTGPVNLRGDFDNSGSGLVNTLTAPIDSGDADITIRGRDLLLGALTTMGGFISITADAFTMNFRGNISTGGGSCHIATLGAPSFDNGMVIDMGNTGTFQLVTPGNNITLPASISITNADKIHINAQGTRSVLTINCPLICGASGGTFMGGNQVLQMAPLESSGDIDFIAGTGAVTIFPGATIDAGESVSFTSRGISLQANVASITGEIVLKPLNGTTATIAAALEGPTRVTEGIAQFTSGSITSHPLQIESGANLRFDTSARTISPSTFSQNGPSGETRILIGGTGVGQFNRISAVGSYTAGGQLLVAFDPGYVPAAGHQFDLFDFSSFVGDFSSYTLPSLGPNQRWDTSQLAVTGTLRILTPIQLWRQQNFQTIADTGAAAHDADEDGDGVRNFLEYAFGMDPTENSIEGLPTIGKTTVEGLDYLTLTLIRPLTTSDVTYRIMIGSNIPAENEGSLYALAGDVPSNDQTTEVSRNIIGDRETIIVRDNKPIGADPRRFMQVKATQQ